MKIIQLPLKVNRPILACGADLKGAFALAKGSKAYLYEGFGDLADADNLHRYETAVRRAERKLKIKPAVIACDDHPGYFSGRFAEVHGLELMIPDLYGVQHHEAHVASVIVEHSIGGKIIGVAFDGTGYGLDGNIWGGEFFTGGIKGFTRRAHFDYMPMPGADAAVREPWRMAVSYLYKAFGGDIHRIKIPLIKNIPAKKLSAVINMIDSGINSPVTSSAGRLFDAVASIVLRRDISRFEAELPIALEKMAGDNVDEGYPFDIVSGGKALTIGTSDLIKSVVRDISDNVKPSEISAKFHNSIAGIILRTVTLIRNKTGIKKVVLTGGVFQNRYLSAAVQAALRKSGFIVYTNSGTNTNDNGIPIGQLAIANARARCV